MEDGEHNDGTDEMKLNMKSENHTDDFQSGLDPDMRIKDEYMDPSEEMDSKHSENILSLDGPPHSGMHPHPQHHHHHHHPHIHPQHMHPLPPFQEGLMRRGNMMDLDDPYSFVDDDTGGYGQGPAPPHMMPPGLMQNQLEPPQPKKRGRKKKIRPEDGIPESLTLKPEKLTKNFKPRKKYDRFNGMPPEEVAKRTLPDHLAPNLDICIVGINPGMFAAYKGHHYAGPGNHFWKCMYLSGLIAEPMTADDDYKLIKLGIGFTNLCPRTTKGSADLSRKEMKEGSQILLDKLRRYRPKIAVFNGKGIYEVFSGRKDFPFGRQQDFIDGTNTYIWVMPSSSARCAQLPRASDKVPYYAALKKFRDYLNGIIPELDESEVVFLDDRFKHSDESTNKEALVKSEQRYSVYGESGGMNGDITDLSNSVIRRDPAMNFMPPVKKKRGRPKKIKPEDGGPVPNCMPHPNQMMERSNPEHDLMNGEPPRKKRGRPKKIKPEPENPPMLTNGMMENSCYNMRSPVQCFSPNQMAAQQNGFVQSNFSPPYGNQTPVYSSHSRVSPGED